MSGLISRFALVAAAAGVIAALSVDARSQTEQPRRECFHPDQADGFSAPTDDKIYVTVSPRRVFELELLGPCPNMDWANRVGIRSTGGGFVCTGMDVELIVPDDPIGPHRCMVRTVRRLSQAEIEARR